MKTLVSKAFFFYLLLALQICIAALYAEQYDCSSIIDDLQCTHDNVALDLVVVFDTTGSMGSEIKSMKNTVNDFLQLIDSSNYDYKLGLTKYEDFPISPCGTSKAIPYFIYNEGNLTSDPIKFQNMINSLKSRGVGNDHPESVLAALTHTVQDQLWRKDSKKIVLLIGDAPPHKDSSKCNQEGNTLDSTIKLLLSKNISTYVIGPDVESMKNIAQKTGGQFYNIASTKSISPILEEIAENIKCNFEINEISNCNEGKLELEVKLLNKNYELMPYIDNKMSVVANIFDSNENIILTIEFSHLSNNDTAIFNYNGTESFEDKNLKINIVSRVCNWSNTKSINLNCSTSCISCASCIDTDYDGVIDVFDKCPETPSNSFVNRHGCPANDNSLLSGRISIKGQPLTQGTVTLIQSGEIFQKSYFDINGYFKFDKLSEDKSITIMIRKSNK